MYKLLLVDTKTTWQLKKTSYNKIGALALARRSQLAAELSNAF